MINDIERSYQEPGKHCTREDHCDAMVLGGLLRALKARDLRPFPNPPFAGVSFSGLALEFGKMPIPTLCEIIHDDSQDYIQNGHSRKWQVKVADRCGVRSKIRDHLELLESSLPGLELDHITNGSATNEQQECSWAA